MQKSGWKSDFLWFSYGYWKCMLVRFLTGYIVTLIVFIMEYIINFSCLKTWSSLFWTCVFILFGFWSSPNHMLVHFLIGYIGHPNCVHYGVHSIFSCLKTRSSLFWTCVFILYGFWSSLNHIPINNRSPIKKLWQIYLIHAWMLEVSTIRPSK